MRKVTYLVGATVIVAAAIVAVIIFINKPDTQKSTTSEPKQNQQKMKSAFTFDAAKAGGWTKGPSNSSSLALFSPDQSCFSSLEKKTAAIDETTAIEEIKAKLTNDGYTVSDAGEGSATLDMPSGTEQYILHQLAVTGTGTAGKLYGGQSYGYIPLENGHLSVSVYCESVNQLATASDALSAIKYDDTAQ